jgi:hypothetical protein
LGIWISEISPRVLGWLETSPLPLRTLHLWANPFPKNNFDMFVPFALAGCFVHEAQVEVFITTTMNQTILLH